ncbi:MAG: hypothetical protein VKJ24_07710 [Synechococcales bacterium]|nr:hypothetical protein [Synechococcales bacterium]
MDELNKYKTQHLFLLVGENPLPNYVAAHLLLESGGKIHLAHSTGTQRQAKQLRKVLETDQIHCLDLPLGDSESNASAIREKIQQRLNTLNGTMGLHYTGGTKAMAVHACQTLKAHAPNAVFSYLNPRRLELCIDQASGESKPIKITPKMLEITIQNLIALHGWDLPSDPLETDPLETPVQPEASTAFAEFHADAELAKLWHDWCHNNLRKKPNGDFKGKTRLNEISIDLKSDANFPRHPKILAALQELGMESEQFSVQQLQVQGGFSDSKKLAEWIDSFWLEHYVLAQVNKIAKDQKIYNSVNSLTTKNPTNTDEKFEIDVVFTRGYQLFGISCTTSHSKSLCKSKLFEAYVRAQQLGGAEARIALVCCTNPEHTDALKTEIVNVFTPIGSEPEDYKIEVFGREDLVNLSEKIAEWIQNVDRDAK